MNRFLSSRSTACLASTGSTSNVIALLRPSFTSTTYQVIETQLEYARCLQALGQKEAALQYVGTAQEALETYGHLAFETGLTRLKVRQASFFLAKGIRSYPTRSSKS